MEIWGDYHIHTCASDGQGHVADKFACASARGFTEIAVADHGFGAILLGQTRKKFDAQTADVLKANAMKSVKVYQSIECTPLNENGDLDAPDDVIERCDVLHMGFHRLMKPHVIRRNPTYFLVNGWGTSSARDEEELVEFNTRAYLNALERYPVDIICHLNHRAKVDVKRIIKVAEEKGIYIELNEKHIETLEGCIDILLQSDVRFITGSDAHRTDKVGSFARVKDFIARHGVPENRICGVGISPVFHSKKGFAPKREDI